MKYAITPSVVAGLAGLLAAGCACEREGDEVIVEPPATDLEALTEDPIVDPVVDPAGPAPQGAVDAIVNARCAREARCENVGVGREYESSDACKTEIRDEWRDELNAFECPGGTVQDELAECLEEINNEDCSAPFDTLGRIVACRSSDICRATPGTEVE